MSKLFRAGQTGLLVVLVAAGCSAPPPPSPPTLDVTVSAVEIVADGVTSVTVGVSHTSDVRLTTTRGKFRESNSPSYTVAGGAGTATLISCDSRITDPCAGTVRISAFSTADNGTGSASLNFKGLENCGNGTDDDGNGKIDCADTACVNLLCTLPTGSVGVGKCNAAGACLCDVDGGTSESIETTCDDGRDNDCDGKIDCADSSCDSKACTTTGGIRTTCKSGACTCTPSPEDNDTACKDGLDNDCDGLIDCEDPTCQRSSNVRGKICDALGHSCSAVTGGVSSCSECSGNGGNPEAGGEVTCGGGQDNDCDGLIDCLDPDCAGRACFSSGATSNGQTCGVLADGGITTMCSCPGPGVETGLCSDNFDNDCDGLVDCADPDCKNVSAVCGPNGRTCSPGGSTCTCSGNGGAAQANETTCNDGADNDCDGLVDCLDPDCVGANANCGSVAGYGLRCAPTGSADGGVGVCNCTGNGGTVQTAETLCNDARDNDCDGLTDCADSTCGGRACDALGRICGSGSCSVCTGNGGTAEASETSCSDGRDNDCDGLVDCSDPNCAGLQCNAVSSNYVCNTGICKDSTSNFSVVVTTAPSRLAANGTSTSTVTATLRNLATPVAGAALAFSVSAGNGTIAPPSGTTNSSGIATATFTSSLLGGFATVQAGYDSGTSIIFGTAQIDQPRLGSIVVSSVTNAIMGVRTSGFNESSTIVFQLNDENAQPYPPGLNVTLTHDQLGGSYTSPGTCVGNTCTTQVVTDANGRVQVVLHSGTAAGVVSVSAGATAGGVSQSGSANNIAVIGAKASGLAVSIICTPRNLPGYSAHDCLKSLYSGPDDRANCTAFFADRFGNVLGRSTLTTYSSESGAASAPSFTGGGTSAGTVFLTGYSLPLDVDAGVGEPSVSWNENNCGVKTHNPRDGLSTIIVSAAGEEGFVDGNGNGIYDTGEFFLDVGEPFVDSNDNNLHDPNEPFVDTNSNNVWDGPNGVWDQDTTIWASTRVVYTGGAASSQVGGLNQLSRWYDLPPATPQPWAPTPQPGAFTITSGPAPTAVNYGVWFADPNGNQPSPRTSYALSVPQGQAQVRFTTDPTTGVNDLGMSFTQQFCDTQTGAGTCGSACAANPCYLVTRISSFTAGRRGVVEIKGQGTQYVGPVEVRSIANFNGQPASISIFGTSQ